VIRRRWHQDRIIVTAAHCLPHFPKAHPARHPEEHTYARLLGPLGTEPTVWAECLFADPMADIAVLCTPDNQELSDEADAYEALVDAARPLAIADAPAQDVNDLTPGKGEARVLSLDGRWLDGRVERRGGWLVFFPKNYIKSGMSGSPIIDRAGKAIGVVSVDIFSPALIDALSTGLLRSIRAAKRLPTDRVARFAGWDTDDLDSET
jgi:hypothetical protein